MTIDSYSGNFLNKNPASKAPNQLHRIPKNLVENLVMPRFGRLNVDWALAFGDAERPKGGGHPRGQSFELGYLGFRVQGFRA